MLLRYLSFFYDCKHLTFSNKPYQLEMNFIENKHLNSIT